MYLCNCLSGWVICLMARARRISMNCHEESLTCNKMHVWGQTSSQNQFVFVTSTKSNTSHSHLKFKFWNCICLDQVFPDEQNKIWSLRLDGGKKSLHHHHRKPVLFLSVLIFIICTAGSSDSCSRREWAPGGLVPFPMQDQVWPQNLCSLLRQLNCRHVTRNWQVSGRESKNSLLRCSGRDLRVGCLCWHMFLLQKLQLLWLLRRKKKRRDFFHVWSCNKMKKH